VRATADPGAMVPPIPVPVYPLPVSKLRHWAEVIAFAIDNPPECIDALLELAADVEGVLEVAA
jgi:hypothetical protein